mmetsp:Transcript_77388/g.224548  ORF Transcript_77388/g.224548 Transcript_77388/m.224548 type:complete len:340 (-) Transcript_77388:1757-2776(-)
MARILSCTQIFGTVCATSAGSDNEAPLLRRHRQERPSPIQDHRVFRNRRDKAMQFQALLLRINQAFATDRDIPSRCEVLVAGRLRSRTSALRHSDRRPGEDNTIVLKMVLMAWQSLINIHGSPHIGKQVVVLPIVMSAIVVLHAIVAVNQDVVMGPVIATAVVIVNVLLRRVVVNEEVVVNLAPLHDDGGLAGAHRCQVRLAVPRIERPVVARLPACGEDEVEAQLVATAEAVVVVDASARTVKEHVAVDPALHGLRLHVEAALLLVEADLSSGVPENGVPLRVIPIRSIDAGFGISGAWGVEGEARVRRLIRVAPRDDRVAPNVCEVVVLDRGIAVVA